MPSPKLSTGAFARLLDALPGAWLVLDGRGEVQLANAPAKQLGCDAGQAVMQLKDPLGTAAATWLQRALLLGRFPPGEVPLAQLADGRRARLQLTSLGDGLWLLQLAQAVAEAPTAAPGTALPALADAARELLRLFWDSPFPASLQDEHFKLVAINRAFVDFTGFTPQELIGRDPIELAPEEDRPMMLALREGLRGDDACGYDLVPTLVERRLVDRAGREHWYRLAVRGLDSDRGERLTLAVLQDCTAEKLARDAVERSVHELDQWFDLSPVGMVLFDVDGLLVRSNAAFESLVGHVPVALGEAGADLQHLLGWQDGSGPHAALRPGAAPMECQGTLALPDGRSQRLRALLRGYETALGQRRFMAVVEDRTLQDERDLAQIEIGALVDTVGLGLATFQESRGWVRSAAASSAGASAGASSSAALQSIKRELVDEASLPEYERLQSALRGGERAEVRYAVRHPDLGLRWLLTRVEPGQLGSGQRTTSVVTLDVTEQQLTLQRNEQLLSEVTTILENTSAGMAYLRGDVLVRCNHRFQEVLRMADGRVAGATLPELFARQKLSSELIEQTRQALANGGSYETELSLPDRAGEPQWFALSVRSVGSPRGVPEAIALLTDITRLKRQQVELVVLARDRELMFSLSDVGIAYLREGRIERANHALAELAGYSPAELLQLDHGMLFEDRATYLAFLEQQNDHLKREGRSHVERRLRRRDGSLVWVQTTKRPVDESDPHQGLICAYVNVDERRRAQASLERQAERTRAILDSVLVGIVTVGREGIEWMNRSARRMFAGELNDFVGETISIVATEEEDHPLRRTHYLDALADGESEAFECRLRARDGREFWVVGNAVVTGREHTSRQVTFALLDIERRRQAELSIAQTQASLQLIIDTAPLAIALLDARTLQVLRLNQMAATFAGRSVDEALGRAPEELFDADTAPGMRQDMAQALASQEVTQREYRRGDAQDPRVWDARYVPLATLSGAPDAPPDQLLLVASDVTEQRAADEARLQAAIAQRERLVKEVHHRIKNNLQGVAGLLQQAAQRRPEVKGVITEAVSQVQAIAQVYGLQVRAAGPLRLQGLFEGIVGSVSRATGRAIAMDVDGEDAAHWTLPEADSIPVALTLNELLGNAVKHSSADARIHCGMVSDDAGVRLVITNSGRLPEGFDLARVRGGVAGLGLVRALLPRRHATLDLQQHGENVVASIQLVPPGVTQIASQ